MRIFLDTANIDQIRQGVKWGVVSGVTTNPTLVAAEGQKDYKSVVKQICSIVDGPVSAEVVVEGVEAMTAQARDIAAWSKNVVVKIPAIYADDPVPFLHELERLTPLLPERGATILINRAKGLIAIDSEVQISPVILSVAGLTIQVTRAPDGQVQKPLVEQQNFVSLDPTNQGGSTLNKLLDHLNQIRVPVKDRISVIEELHRMGMIHARLIYEE